VTESLHLPRYPATRCCPARADGRLEPHSWLPHGAPACAAPWTRTAEHSHVLAAARRSPASTTPNVTSRISAFANCPGGIISAGTSYEGPCAHSPKRTRSGRRLSAGESQQVHALLPVCQRREPTEVDTLAMCLRRSPGTACSARAAQSTEFDFLIGLPTVGIPASSACTCVRTLRERSTSFGPFGEWRTGPHSRGTAEIIRRGQLANARWRDGHIVSCWRDRRRLQERDCVRSSASRRRAQAGRAWGNQE